MWKSSAVIFLTVCVAWCLGSTVIFVEDAKACFRRVLAGKRIARGFVKRALTCERVEDCQQECAEEKQFTCEGFNYRLDPAGRGEGDCELIDIPLSRLDYSRDVYPDPDYDYYEKERNTVLECRGVSSSGGSYYGPSSGGGGYYGSSSGGGYYGPNSGGGYYGSSGGGGSYYGPSSGGGYYGQSGGGSGYYGSSGGGGYYGPSSGGGYPYSPSSGGGGYYPDNRRGGSSSSCRGCVEKRPGYYDRRPPDYDRGPPPRIPAGGGGLYDDERYGPTGPRRGDTLHHYHHSQPHYDYHHSLPPPIHRNHHFRPPDYRPYEPYLPPRRYDNRDRDHWGLKQKGWATYGGTYGYDYGRNNNRYDGNHYGGRNYYLPPRKGESGGWGLYGNGGADGYWGLRKGYGTGWSNQGKFYDYGELPPTTGTTYLPSSPSSYPQTITYLPASTGSSYPTLEPTSSNHPSTTWKGVVVKDDDFRGRSDVLPMKPSGYAYDFVKEECSLRAVAGFKLRSAVVKKLYSVPSIYDCEFLCFKEKDFVCASYAYRYVSYYDPAVSNYKENCFLSSKNYRTLDYYHDVEPDRDFDIYTMNNLEKCEQQTFAEEEVESECFWRVRSGYSFDNAITRDSLDVPSIVECQLECLRSKRFTCRAFSFRYGPPLSRRDNQNCRLTDWPFYQIDPKTQLILEPGFEVYERGSFGHGCEPVRFGVRKKQPLEEASLKSDQICYVGFGSPARLLPEATRNALSVSSELDCKIACSTARKSTLFQCMSFSYTSSSPKDVPNCYLSDIYQRDLLSSVDYIGDRNSWLFAWDNYNPECMALAGGDDNEIGGRRNGKYRDEDRRGSERTISIYHPIDTWRVYSVSGWPCRQGTTCQQHKHAGFWFCELEGGDANSWDYCCSPHNQCGYSEGYPYQWCYVGNDKTQWRTCSDRYYPYYPHHPHTHSKYYLGDKYGSASQGNYITDTGPKFEYRPGARPDRPPAPPRDRPPDPSLNEYEQQFDTQFLPPPKPGGFGPPRHWPVSYLHKQMPPNVTSASTQNKTARMQTSPKYAAIQNLIEIFKSNDLKNIKYQITNGSEKNDDALFVKIPLPTNFTQETMTEKAQKLDSEFTVLLPKEINDSAQNSSARSLAANETSNTVAESRESKKLSLYRRSYIERTNVTTHGRRSRRYSDN